MLRLTSGIRLAWSRLHKTRRFISDQHNLKWSCEKVIEIPSSELGLCRTKMGHLSESGVLAKAGSTMVHVTVNSKVPDAEPREDFLPLTVDYRSRAYAFGMLPNMQRRRERHNDEEEVLVARVIDRTIRPLFPKGYTNEVQVTATSHAVDDTNDPVVLAVNAASAALYHSKQPWNGPIGCVRIGQIGEKLVINPSTEEMKGSALDLLYAGTYDRTLMIEMGGYEIPEHVLIEAIHLAHQQVQHIIAAQQQLPSESFKKTPFSLSDEDKSSLLSQYLVSAKDCYRQMTSGKEGRGQLEGAFRERVQKELRESSQWGERHRVEQGMALDYICSTAFREVVLEGAQGGPGGRVDGRHALQLRPLGCDINILPLVHGSAYFSRGDTHMLSTVTLGPPDGAALSIPVQSPGTPSPQMFYLHYDFPPYCTGEVGSASAPPNRRMIGHGKLAEKALRYLLPPFKDFPYSVRVFAECTASNGSSSMAAVCAGGLALLDAGVPLKNVPGAVSVGGVSTEKGVSLLLKDIIGSEDHYGDMDFKVAGTTKGVTAIQLDVKLSGGIPLSLFPQALEIAKEGRQEIIQHLQSQWSDREVKLKPHSPRGEVVEIEEDRVEYVLGPRGETLKFLQKTFNVEITFPTPNTVHIYGQDSRSVLEVKGCVEDLGRGLVVGGEVSARIVEILDYGVVVRINRAGEGLVHVSDFSHDEQVVRRPLKEVIQVGQKFKAKVLSVDISSGAVKLSRRQLLPASEPDKLTDLQNTSEEELKGMLLQEVPPFPLQPPRTWSKDYFRSSIATVSDISKAMKPPAPASAPTYPQRNSPSAAHSKHKPNGSPQSLHSNNQSKARGPKPSSYFPQQNRGEHSKHRDKTPQHKHKQNISPSNPPSSSNIGTSSANSSSNSNSIGDSSGGNSSSGESTPPTP